MINLNEKISFQGKEIEIKEFLSLVLKEEIHSRRPLSISDLQKHMKKVDINEIVTSAEDFEKFMTNSKTEGLKVKDLLKVLIKEFNISINSQKFGKCEKKHLRVIFFSLFELEGMEKTQDKEQRPDGVDGQAEEKTEKIDNEDEKSASEKDVKVEIRSIRRKELQKILDQGKKISREDIDVSNFTLVDKLPVTLQKSFYIIVPQGIDLYYGCMAILKKNGEIAAFGTLQDGKDGIHLILPAENITFESFRHERNFTLAFFPATAAAFFAGNSKSYTGEIYTLECPVTYKDLDSANQTLCIDFGTSNTTVGSYGIVDSQGNEPELVEFLDVTKDSPEVRRMLPTMVYVSECENDKVTRYQFGYEARKRVIEQDYNTKASVFYEIKRWVNTMDATEEVVGENGYTAKVSHREIITAYILHVLELAERHFEKHFTKLHFSAPVKLKESFLKEMEDSLKPYGYQVLRGESSLDEGISIIYYHIAERIRQAMKKKGDIPEEKVLIMDCGGGTTDLASCSYKYTMLNVGLEKDIGTKLSITTRFENGDSNFGGNNITYLILQMLKIKMAALIKGKKDAGDIKQLLDYDENELLEEVDEWYRKESNKEKKDISHKTKRYGNLDPYGKFKKAYEEADTFIPTKFADVPTQKKAQKVKRNYYYLWQMAEAIKVEFYREYLDLVNMDFANPDDKRICIPNPEQYYLWVQENNTGELVKRENPMEDIEITINDIRRCLYPAIYMLLKFILNEYDNKELLDYKYYKLSGQSCKIPLFLELLKEFVPGNKLRSRGEKRASSDSSTLKTACIEGSISYMRDVDYGVITPDFTIEQPRMLYKVYQVEMARGEEPRLYTEEDAVISSPYFCATTATKACFSVRDKNGVEKNRFLYNFKDGGEKITIGTLDAKLKKITNMDINSITGMIKSINFVEYDDDAVTCLFMVPSKLGYGMHIYQLQLVQPKKNNLDIYMQQDGLYQSFENEELETFFDGRK